MSKKAPILPMSPHTDLPVNLVFQSREIVDLWYLTYGSAYVPDEALPVNPQSGKPRGDFRCG